MVDLVRDRIEFGRFDSRWNWNWDWDLSIHINPKKIQDYRMIELDAFLVFT